MLLSVCPKRAGRHSNFLVLVRFITRISGSMDFLPINVSINDVLGGISAGVDVMHDCLSTRYCTCTVSQLAYWIERTPSGPLPHLLPHYSQASCIGAGKGIRTPEGLRVLALRHRMPSLAQGTFGS